MTYFVNVYADRDRSRAHYTREAAEAAAKRAARLRGRPLYRLRVIPKPGKYERAAA